MVYRIFVIFDNRFIWLDYWLAHREMTDARNEKICRWHAIKTSEKRQAIFLLFFVFISSWQMHQKSTLAAYLLGFIIIRNVTSKCRLLDSQSLPLAVRSSQIWSGFQDIALGASSTSSGKTSRHNAPLLLMSSRVSLGMTKACRLQWAATIQAATDVFNARQPTNLGVQHIRSSPT